MADDLHAAPRPLIDQLRQIVGAENVREDEAHRRLMSEDIFSRGALVSATVAPASLEQAADVVRTCANAGIAIAPRGGGMSYTSGYITRDAGAVLVDMRRMNRVLAVNEQDMTVTVEAGATWADLHGALRPLGLRTPFWGPLSGLASTIGGGLSQNNAFFGSGAYGPTGDSVLSVTVIAADGSLVQTGSAGTRGAKPFTRHFGPDLTGLFVGDCGALGLKAEATLRLIRAPSHEGWASFSFQEKAACARAMTEIARAGLASELFGFDPNLARVRMRRASLLSDVGALAKVVGAQKSLFAGIKEAAKIAIAGRDFLDGADYSLHAVAEGRSKAAVEADLAEIRRIALAAQGVEVENTIPKVIRAQPFAPLNSVLGPGGERWAPVHGIVAMSDALACWEAIDALFASMAAELEAAEVVTGFLVTTLSTTMFLIEPVFFWPDERFAVHDATVEASYLAKLPRLPANPASRAAVETARRGVIDIFTRFGAAHFQIGRAYPYAQTREPATLALLQAIKSHIDPKGVINPGALGL